MKKAFLSSFVVYLAPLVNRHGFSFFGPALIAGWTSGARREPLWIAADLSLALGYQALAGLLLYWFLHRPAWPRAILVGAAVFATLPFLSALYQVVIPACFLIEPDRAPEQIGWEMECSVPDAWLAPVRSPAGLALERAGETLISRQPRPDYALLRAPGCESIPLPLRAGEMPSNFFLAPGGRLLYQTIERGSAHVSWWYCDAPGSPPVRIEEPAGDSPILSNDGQWIVWVLRNPPRVLLRALGGSREDRTVSLAPISPGSFVPLEADLEAGVLTLVRNAGELFEVKLDGSARQVTLPPGGARPLDHTIRRVGSGWVLWGGYDEREPYRLAWSLPAGSGVHRVTKGRAIQSVSVHPDGRLLALSVSRMYSIGEVRDSVYVIRVSDGAEVFRQYLPRYTRTQVAFLGARHFAYCGPDGGKSAARVLRVPSEALGP